MKIFFSVVIKFSLVAKASTLAYLRDLNQSRSNMVLAREI